MVLPILISVSLAPGSYLFCAVAELAATVMPPTTTAAVIHVRWNVIESSQISCCVRAANPPRKRRPCPSIELRPRRRLRAKSGESRYACQLGEDSEQDAAVLEILIRQGSEYDGTNVVKVVFGKAGAPSEIPSFLSQSA